MKAAVQVLLNGRADVGCLGGNAQYSNQGVRELVCLSCRRQVGRDRERRIYRKSGVSARR